MPKISIMPEAFWIGGVNVGFSVVVAWGVIALLIGVLLFFRGCIRHFQQVPHGIQNFLELIVEGMYHFAQDKVGHCADTVAPVTMTLMLYVASTTLVELVGISPSTEDLNCTLALGLCSFVLVNVTALRYKGVGGRIRSLASPSPIAMPIRILTDCIAPLSMGIRLFANVMVGGVIMKLIYAVVPIILPAIVASYFNVLHVGIQTFVFGLLSLIYVGEAVE
ncbi:MAG: FoF1 ATP synthase subunit a [Clostridia bacterium]